MAGCCEGKIRSKISPYTLEAHLAPPGAEGPRFASNVGDSISANNATSPVKGAWRVVANITNVLENPAALTVDLSVTHRFEIAV